MPIEETHALQVPGATLHYKVRGSGPVLLLLLGGAADADGSDGLASHLTDHFTVVSHDRRGLSRSTIDGPVAPMQLPTHSDDARRVLAAVTSEPALVFGSSIGALIALDLTIRHPDSVKLLISHEPPAPQLLPEAERAIAVPMQEDIEETFRREGVGAAMRKFLVINRVNYADREADAPMPQPNERVAANTLFFLTHDAAAVRLYDVDKQAVLAVRERIVAAAGSTSRENWPHRCAQGLATLVGTPLVEFPGGHAGYVSHPRGFASKLTEVLQTSR